MANDSACRLKYQGDAALDRLLAKAGSPYGAAAARALLAGVVAAPEPDGRPAAAWMSLVAADPGPALQAQLAALKAELASAGGDSATARWTPARLAEFRAELTGRNLAGFVLPRGDEHQGEYVAPRAERLAWLTGFTGSAGLAIVLQERAAIFVDGRYTLQVRAEVDVGLFEPRHLIDEPPADWLAAAVPAGTRIGFDPWLHTAEGIAKLKAACAKADAELVAVEGNPVDAIWKDQPPPPIAPVVPHDLRFAGRAAGDKRAELAHKLAADGFAAAVLTAPDSIAWLLNIRGGDVPHTPLALSFAILNRDGGLDLFIDARKLAPGTAAHLGTWVRVHAPEALGPELDRACRAASRPKARILVDAATASVWIGERIEKAGAEAVRGQDPCALPKACKNDTELEGARLAHRRDGAAMARFLAWLAGEAPKGALGELDAARHLLECRCAGENFRDLSFTTISGAGPNGAIVHYRVTAATNRRLAPDMIYLVDSGAQYLEATTDVTRAVAIGRPTAEQRDRFTRVLKGHIAIATARFPKGTTGPQLDILARQALWAVGLDYDHGTGHGVGSYLAVHEGPQRIAKLPNPAALRPGMIVSNEPGYYKAGEYGIRTENLVAVREVEVPVAPGDAEGGRKMLGFETLTLVPIDRALIEVALLGADERAWLDAYHERVRETISPLVDAATAGWLAAATRPLRAQRRHSTP
ncbi:MAG: aminopeptidase P family protein [Pseudomonadota bacterium]